MAGWAARLHPAPTCAPLMLAVNVHPPPFVAHNPHCMTAWLVMFGGTVAALHAAPAPSSSAGPQSRTSWIRSRARMWSSVSRVGDSPPCMQKICAHSMSNSCCS